MQIMTVFLFPVDVLEVTLTFHPLERTDRRGSPRRWHRQRAAVYHSYRLL